MKKTKRRIVKKITKKRLDEFLGLVGWYTRFHGAGTWRLYNPYGGVSLYQFTCHEGEEDQPIYNLRLDEFSDHRVFGECPEHYDHAGFSYFLLRNCTLEAHSEDNGETWEFVSINIAAQNPAASICFQKPFFPEKSERDYPGKPKD